MKKVLIGLVAGALAFTATTAPVSAGSGDPSIYEIVQDADYEGGVGELLIDSAGLDELLDACGNGEPQYTVFYPAVFTGDAWDEIIDGDGNTGSDLILGALDLSLGQLLAQPALIKALLLYHVVPSEVTESQLYSPENTKFNTMGGLTLLKTVVGGDAFINGYPVYFSADACNGYVHVIGGVLAPNNDVATIGLTNDGSTTQAAGAGTGAGLPATGASSMALTYAALASLLAGAGVLVIRRRSVA